MIMLNKKFSLSLSLSYHYYPYQRNKTTEYIVLHIIFLVEISSVPLRIYFFRGVITFTVNQVVLHDVSTFDHFLVIWF